VRNDFVEVVVEALVDDRGEVVGVLDGDQDLSNCMSQEDAQQSKLSSPCGRGLAPRIQLELPVTVEIRGSSKVNRRICPRSSCADGASFSLRVFTVIGPTLKPRVLRAASISYQESPTTIKFVSVPTSDPALRRAGDDISAWRSESSSWKACRFQAKGSSGKYCS